MTITDYVTTGEASGETGYPQWAVRRAADALGVAQRFSGARAIPRGALDSISDWMRERGIKPMGEVAAQ